MNLGKICYDAYKNANDGCIAWGALTKEMQKSWTLAAEAVRDTMKKPKKELTEEEKTILKEKRVNDLKKKNEERRELEQLKKESQQFRELKAQINALSDDKETFTVRFD